MACSNTYGNSIGDLTFRPAAQKANFGRRSGMTSQLSLRCAAARPHHLRPSWFVLSRVAAMCNFALEHVQIVHLSILPM